MLGAAFDLEGCEDDLRLRGIIQAESAIPDSRHGITLKVQWMFFP